MNVAVHPLWGSLALDRSASESLQDQIVGYFRNAIISGHIPAGRRVPSSRQLADEHNISRTTASEAYDRLTAEGYLYPKDRIGLFVSESLPEDFMLTTPRDAMQGASAVQDDIAAHLPFDPARYRMLLAPGMPALDKFPWKHWSQHIVQILRERPIEALYYGDPRGEFVLRSAIAEYLADARGIICTPDQIAIVGTSRHGMDIAARHLATPGGKVWVEEPGYLFTRSLMKEAGLDAVPVAVDEKGMIVADARRKAPDARLALLSPSHQYGMGVTLSLERRQELLEWAETSDGWIIEDDRGGEYRYSGKPISPLYSLDRAGRVIYIGSFSNLLAPGLRMGYIVVPPTLTSSFMPTGASMVSLLEQLVVARFISGGYLATHLRRMRGIYSARRRVLIDELRNHAADLLEIGKAPEAGTWVAAHLLCPRNDQAITEQAAQAGIFVHPLSVYYADPERKQGFIIGFASTPEDKIGPAVRYLAGLIRASE